MPAQKFVKENEEDEKMFLNSEEEMSDMDSDFDNKISKKLKVNKKTSVKNCIKIIGIF